MAAKAIQQRPHGRDEVVAAIHAAALRLLAERGPRDVTVREIAAAAGVNHALVHRHFGTKDELVRAVIRTESDAIAQAAGTRRPDDVAGLLALLDDHAAYWRILARTVLDAPTLLEDLDMPAARAFVEVLGGAGGPREGQDARTAAALSGALALGWIVFGAHLSRVVRAEVTTAELTAALGRVAASRPARAVDRA